MKIRHIYSGLLTLLLLGIMSCNESFLEVTPTNVVSSEIFYTTQDDFITAVTGVYGINCTWRQIMEFVPMIDMATPAAVHGGSNRFGHWHWGGSGYTPDDLLSSEVPYKFWQKWWLGIERANEVIYRLSQVSDDIFSSESIHNRIEGEVLFMRAFCYFHLTYTWGGLPLLTEPTTEDTYYPSKVDQALIVAQIIDDLNAASTLLPSVTTYRGTENLGRASKGAAMALLGKTYCFEEQWEKADSVLIKLIETGDYQLTQGSTGFIDQFWPDYENGEESIFEIQYASGLGDQLGNAFISYCATGGVGIDGGGRGYGYIQPTDWYVDYFETINGYTVSSTYDSTKSDGSYAFSYTSDDPDFDPENPFDNLDPRFKWTVMYEGSPYVDEKWPDNTFTSAAPDQSNFATAKYIVDQTAFAQSDMNLIVLRYADVLLLYAEALVEQGELDNAAAYVNQVRNRPSVNMPDVPESVAASQSLLREYIHDERIRELAFEYGHLFFDLRRWTDGSGNNLWLTEMQNYWTANKLGHTNDAIDIDEHNILWPIPQDEMDLNPNLEQNDGY